MIKKITYLLLLTIPVTIFSQFPGGVAAPDFWVKSDDAGNIATAWTDHSANGDDIPAVGAWTLSPADRAHNFHPYTTGYTASKYFYNNNNSTLHSSTGVGVEANHSIFSAVRPTSANTQGRIIGLDDDTGAAEPGVSITNAGLPNHYEFSRTTTDTDFTTPFITRGINIFSATTNNVSGIGGGTSSSSGGEKRLGLNGVYQTTTFTGSNRFQLVGKRLRIGDSGWTHGDPFPGDIMEIIWYNRLLTPNEQSRVNSYLAMKNGATLGEDYLTASSAVIWNRTLNTGYNNNIFGIVRDDASALHQKQAASTNPNQKLIIGNGTTLFNTNALNTNNLTNGQSLIIGDNGLKQRLTVPFVYTSGTNGSTNYRFESVWKAQNTGSAGPVTVAWPKSFGNMYLVQSADPTFATGNVYTPMTTEVTVNGVVYNTATVTLGDGQFFTFAGYAHAPGGVLADLLMWHKADDDVTTPGQKSIWKDVTQNARDVFQTNNAAYQPLLVTDASYTADSKNYKFNFNPFYYFDGTNDFFYNEGVTYFPTTNSPGSAYGVMMNSASGGFRTAYGWGDDDPNFLRLSDEYYVTRNNGTVINENVNATALPAHIGGMNWRGAANGIYMNVNGRIYANETANIGAIQSAVNFAIGSEGAGLTGNGNELHQGALPEVFAYSADHRNSTGDELQRINSYLAIKYGITLTSTDGTTVPDYLSSGSVPVWNSTNNAGYNNNIFGIAQDFPSALHQKQSTSANDNQKLVISNGSSLFDTNAANTNSIADGEFLIVGDNGLRQGLSTPLAYTAGTNGEVNFRFESIWKAQKTAGIGTVTVAWPKGIQNFYLVQSTNDTFDSGDTFTPMTTEITVNGVVYNTATVTLGNGEFFTFAGYGHAPGGVVNSLSYWYRADKDASNTGVGTDVTSWTDFFSGNVIGQMGTNAFPKYVDGAANYFNFNPGVNFTAGNQTLGTVSVRTFSADSYDVFTFTKEGMLSGGAFPSIFRSLVDNAFLTGGLRRWDGLAIQMNNGIERLSNTGGNTDTGVFTSPGDFSATIPSIMYHTFTANTTTRALNGNANFATTNHGGTGVRNLNGGHLFGDSQFGDNGSDNRGFIGHLGETIIYGAGNLSDTERRRVDSYMAIKYGITLERVDTDHYLGSTASPSSIVWSGTLNTVYNNNIFGVARADIGGFEQKVSKSVNSGTILTIATIADFVLPNSDASRTGFSDDESYFILGDNNNAATTPLTDITIGGDIAQRIPRIWLSQRTNTPGSLYFEAELSSYGASFVEGNAVYMLVADDEAFTTNLIEVPGTFISGKWVFNYDFDADATSRYITFAGVDTPLICTEPGATGTPLSSSVGILTKEANLEGWPEDVPNGYLVLDSSEKGFVITHMTTAERDLLTPLEGMMIYNTTENCVQLYRGTSPTVDSGRTGWNCIEQSCGDVIAPRNVQIGYWSNIGYNFFSNHGQFRSQLENTSNYGNAGIFQGITGWDWINATTDVNATEATFSAAQLKGKYDIIVTGWQEMSAASASKIKQYTDLGGVVFVLMDAGEGVNLNIAFGGGTIPAGVNNAPSRSLDNQISNGLFGNGGNATITGAQESSLPAVTNLPPGSFILGYVNNPDATSTTNASVYITGAEGRAIFVYDEGIFRHSSVSGTLIDTAQEMFIHNLMSYALQKVGFSAQ